MEKNPKPLSILHLEDNKTDAMLIAHLVKKEIPDCVIEHVGTPEAYAEALMRDGFNIILSDYRMPMYDGDQALKLARRTCPNVPFIMVTGELGEDRAIETVKRGATDYVLKDNLKRLVPSIRRAIEEAETARQRRDTERRLKEERNLLQAIMDSAKRSHLVYLDRDFNFVRVNEAYAKTCGYAPEEMIGKNHFALYPHEENEAIFKRVRDTGIAVEYHDKPFVFPDQPERGVTYWDWTLEPIKDASGTAQGLVFALTETTERKRAELALKETEARLRFALETSYTGAWDLDLTDHTAFRSLEHDRIFGYTELLPQWTYEMFLDHVLPEDRAGVDAKFRHATAMQSDWNFECRIRRTDGEVRWIWVAGHHQLLADGTARRMTGIVQDITERKRAEERLRESEEEYRRIVETANEGIVLADHNRRIIFANQKAAEMVGYTREELFGKNTDDFILDEDRTRVIQSRAVLDAGGSTSAEIQLRCKDGTAVWVLLNSSGVVDASGQHVGNLSMITDITERKQSEETLRKLSRAVVQSPSSIVITDTNGTIEYVNPAFARVTGYSPEEAIGQNPRILKSGVTSDDEYKQLWTTISAGMEWRGEFCNKKKNGELYWELASISPVKDTDGTITHFVAVKEDITQRKRAEEALRQHTQALELLSGTATQMLSLLSLPELFRLVAERIYAVAGGAIVIFNEFDASNRKVIVREFCCTSAEREKVVGLLGRSPEGLAFDFLEGTRQRILPGELVRVEDGMQYLTLGQMPFALCERLEQELRLGDIFAMACSFEGNILGTAVILTHKHGHLPNKEMIESLVNQTALAIKRKQTEDELLENRKQLSLIIETAMDSIITLDEQQRIVLFNNAAEEMFGYTASEVIGEPHEMLMPERFRRAHREQVARFGEARITSRSMGNLNPIITGLRKSGEEFPIEASISQIDLSGKKFFTVILRDVTERKRIEEERQRLNQELDQRIRERTHELEMANRELESFSYSVSHDLKAPLRAIQGFSKILAEECSSKLSEDEQHYLDSIVQNTTNMNRLVEDLLTLSRLSKQTLVRQEVDMASLARTTASEVQHAEPTYNAVEVVIEERLPSANADPVLICQVLVNLLSNAFKFTRNTEHPRIEIGSCQQKENDSKVTVYYVRDNGIGFDMQYADRLFGVFQRLHDVREYEGTGIGLTNVKRIVERHGGRVWAEGKIGEGATFYFTLPNLNDVA